ncbi:MAG TPA: hypothetical protein VM219_00690 [Phycisphaerae bacterium]|nr:hypothetical protein [Phycisphaerae bacterium]
MYRHILRLLREFVGDKAEMVLVVGLSVLAAVVLLLLSRSWRRGVKEALARGGWRAVVLGLVNGLLNLLVGASLIAALGGALLVQSGLFREHHGQVTQRNYGAVRTNWGPPHEQRELSVAHYITEEETVLVFPDGRRIVEKEGEIESLPTGEKAPTRIKRKVRKRVPQNSVVRGKVSIDVWMDYRPKGSAYYTCYKDEWTFDYTVRNRSDETTEAEFTFPMPAKQGVFRDFTIRVNGRDWAEHLMRSDTSQTWKMTMAPGQETRVQVHFTSRGIDHIRYTLAYMSRRDDYQVTMRLFPDPKRGKQRLVWVEDMAVPIGCMTPLVREDSPTDGEPMVLRWDFNSLVTTFGMGVILPKITQPGYYVTRLLHEAPLGLFLLAASLVVTWMLLGRKADLFSLGVLSVGYYLFYTLLAYLSDHLASFAGCFALAAGATLLLAALYLWLGWGRTFAASQTVALMVAFAVYYPLAVVLDDYTGLMTQILYWSLAVYVAMLAVARLWHGRRAVEA